MSALIHTAFAVFLTYANGQPDSMVTQYSERPACEQAAKLINKGRSADHIYAVCRPHGKTYVYADERHDYPRLPQCTDSLYLSASTGFGLDYCPYIGVHAR